MTTTIGSLDLTSQSALYDETQYFWFESSSSSAWGSGAHVTLYPESEFTNSSSTNYLKGQNILMNTDGLSIRNGVLPMMTLDNDSLDFNVVDVTNGTYTNVASFGATSTIGVTDGSQSYLYMDYRSLQMIDKNNNVYFEAKDLRNQNGQFELTDTFLGNGSVRSFTLSMEAINTTYVVLLNDTEVTDNIIKATTYIIFNGTAPSTGDIISVTYTTESDSAKSYTLGIRKRDTNVGAMSIAEGYNVEASGVYSYAKGYYTTASGRYSHAEGYITTASGFASHAEGDHTTASGYNSHAVGDLTTASGYISHAEGSNTTASGTFSHAEGSGTIASNGNTHAEGSNTIASGNCAHAEGFYTIARGFAAHAEGSGTASGNYSHAGGYNTIASAPNQTAIGLYNKEDVDDEFLFIVGNGSSNTARSNAFMVDKTGDVYPQATKMTDFITEQGSIAGNHGTWYYRKWKNGMIEAWYNMDTAVSVSITTSAAGTYRGSRTATIPSGIFTSTPIFGNVNTTQAGTTIHGNIRFVSNTQAEVLFTRDSSGTVNVTASIYLMGYETT